MDVLSDVLRTVRLSSSVFFTADMRAPWSVESPAPEVLAAALGSETSWVMLFHVVAYGSCVIEVEPGRSVRLDEGDVAIFPHGNSHVMASTLEARTEPTPIAAMLPRAPVALPCQLAHGDGSETTTRLVCGYLQGDEQFTPLARALPSLLCVRTGDHGAAIETLDGDVQELQRESPRGAWLEMSLRYAMQEAGEGGVGAESSLARLTELLFVQVVRSYMERSELEQGSWLAGLKDVHVGKALALLHERPDHDWTVDELAREVGTSRSSLGQRFGRCLGQSPMRYLAAWRMQRARTLMRDPRLGLAEIATRVGYESEAAFHRAFKRHTGEPPATWRRRHVAG